MKVINEDRNWKLNIYLGDLGARSACLIDKNRKSVDNYRSIDIDLIDQSIVKDTHALRSSNFIGFIDRYRIDCILLTYLFCSLPV